MDPRDRADAALARARARARARSAYVVTPDDAVSPMDATSTLQIPRAVVNAADPARVNDSTVVIPAAAMNGMLGNTAAMPTQPLPAQQASCPAPPPGGQTGGYRPVPQQPEPSQINQQQRPPVEQPQARELDGLVPTVQQPGTDRTLLSRRLEGEL